MIYLVYSRILRSLNGKDAEDEQVKKFSHII